MTREPIDPFAPPPIDPGELERAQRELGVSVHKLKKPFTFGPFVFSPAGAIVTIGDDKAAERLARRRTAERN